MQLTLCEGPDPTQRQVQIVQTNYDAMYPLPHCPCEGWQSQADKREVYLPQPTVR
jgi:hypothetical protein